jgi:hypothetical protein
MALLYYKKVSYGMGEQHGYTRLREVACGVGPIEWSGKQQPSDFVTLEK